MQALSSWCKALETAADAEAALEELTSYGLHSHAQHLDVLHTPGLVRAMVQQLQMPTSQAHAPLRLTAEQADHVEAALEAAVSLTISEAGLQALVQNGAVEAACRVLQACLPLPDLQPPKKRKCAESLPSAMVTADEEAVQDILPLAVQLLAALLLEPSAARPPVGCLDSSCAAQTAATLLQVLPTKCWAALEAKQQQDAAAVFMRLAMEPGVLDPVCQQAAAADGTKCQFACEARDSMPAQLDGLSRILGARAPAHNFVAQDWETQPAIISSANQQHAQHPPLPAQQQLGSTASNSSKASSAAEQLEAYLTPEVVLRELLQGALHCPVLPAILLDPVQVLQDLRTQGLLLQRLQPNNDLRIIKTQPTASPNPSTNHGMNSAQCSSPITTQQTDRSAGRADEVLWGLEGSVSTDSCVAALQAGFTIVLRDMPKRCPAVCALVDALEEQLGLPAGANLYLTPAGAQGLKAHYDDHDVFVLQLAGSKTWVIGPPQHPPLPLTHQLRLPVAPPLQYQQSLQLQQGQHAALPPACLPPPAVVPAAPGAACSGPPVLPQAEATGPQVAGKAPAQGIGWPQGVVLQPGDCLYIPRGWVHQAVAAEAQAAGALASELTADDPVLRVADGSSLHLSVGVEVAAEASVQGFLHHLIEVCARTAAAGTCTCSQHGRSDQQGCSALPEAQPLCWQQGKNICTGSLQVEWLAVQAAALVLHMRLCCLARAHPVYRKACPLLATGNAVQWLSDAVAAQLWEAIHSDSTPTAPAIAQVATPGPDHPSHPLQHEDSKQHPAAHQLQAHHTWVLVAVQQLMQDSSAACFDYEVLAQLVHQVLGSSDPASVTTDVAANPAPGVVTACTGRSQDSGSAGDGLLSLYTWLEGPATCLCSTCGSSCCHSKLACAAAVLLHAANTTPYSRLDVLESLQGHVLGCACCLAALRDKSAVGRGGGADSIEQQCGLEQTVAAALHLQAAIAAVQYSLCCAGCQSKAWERYESIARGQLTSFQAMRKAFLEARALNQVLRLQE